MESSSKLGLSENSLLAVEDVSLIFNARAGLHHVDLHLERGRIYALFGEHGSGKTTLCEVLAGLAQPQSGSVRIHGKPTQGYTYARATTAGVLFVDQDVLLNENITVNDFFNLQNAGYFRHLFSYRGRNARKVGRFLDDYGIDISPTALIRKLPIQQRVLISIFQRIYHEPLVLILDESIDKLTLDNKRLVYRALLRLRKEGKAVLLATHDTRDVYGLADTVVIMRAGEIVLRESVNHIDELSIIRIAYTQAMQDSRAGRSNADFYSLLKFNQAILERLPVGLLILDYRGVVKNANASCEQFFGEDSLNDRTVDDLFAGNPALLDRLRKGFESRTGVSLIGVTFQMGSGYLTLNVVTYPVVDGDHLLGHVLILSDVTEQEFLRQKIIVSEKMAGVGLLAAGVAHEINNPLEVVMSSLDAIRLTSSEEDKAKYLSYIEEEIDRISRIVANLVSYGRTERDNGAVDTISVVREVIALVEPYAQAHSTEVTVELPDTPLPLVAVNAAELKQVLLNVLKNSVHAITHERGHIRVIVAPSNGLDRIQITVDDNGTGIAEEALQQVFMPFYSAGPHGGSGLGLYICYQILEKHGGSIEFVNKRLGARCVIELPAATLTARHDNSSSM